MAKRTGPVHVVTTTREHKGKTYHSYLLCRSYREGSHVRKETVGNLSHLPLPIIDLIRRALREETLIPVDQFEVVHSVAHGDVHAVLTTIDRLRVESGLSPRPCPDAARVIAPHTKLATTRWWHTRTLADDFGLQAVSEDDVYAAMDWLLDRQDAIERTLAGGHLAQGGLVLYDVSSSYFEGTKCPLAKRGYNRDGKRDKLQVNYGLVTNGAGCPVAVSVFEGNVADTTTLVPQVQRLRERFGIRDVVIVGDRGMIAQTSIDTLKTVDGVAWITALKSAQIRTLLTGGGLQLGLFDDRNPVELDHPDYPGERVMAGRNPERGKLA